jgi:hypothetical protein
MSKAHQITTSVDTKVFLANASNMKVQELEDLVRVLSGVIYRKKSSSNAFKEKKLLRLINEAVLETDKREKYWKLADQLETGEMTESEHSEFMGLVVEDESLRNTRLKFLIELAQLRNEPLSVLMEDLGLVKH